VAQHLKRNLAERHLRRGYSSTEFVLRMTREEIGSYLGIKFETVSRQFSRIQEGGLIQVQSPGEAARSRRIEAARQQARLTVACSRAKDVFGISNKACHPLGAQAPATRVAAERSRAVSRRGERFELVRE
jgi:hypothetical protein